MESNRQVVTVPEEHADLCAALVGGDEIEIVVLIDVGDSQGDRATGIDEDLPLRAGVLDARWMKGQESSAR